MENKFANRRRTSRESQAQKILNYCKPNNSTSALLKRKLPIIDWLPKYTLEKFLQDLLAGFTVALTEVPQSIAYAGVAKLPVEYGLYSFMGGFVYATLGTCKDVNQGPTSLIALIIQPHVIALGPDVAVLMSFLMGLVIFMLGLLNLGFVIEFFSFPIIAGFTCAGALQIASTQLNGLFGLIGKAEYFLDACQFVFHHIHETRKWDVIVSVISIVVILTLKYVGRFGSLQHRSEWSTRRNILGKVYYMLGLGRSAIVVMIGTAVAFCLGADNVPFRITGDVRAGFPSFKPPPFSTNGTDFNGMVNEIGSTMVFLPLVAILEAISIAKNFSKGRPLDASQELICLGTSNVIGSFFSSMPITGSFSRSAINNASGVKTSMSGVITSCIILLSIGVLTPTFKYVPTATLASVIVCAMIFLFDYEAFILLWRAKKTDLLLLIVTFLSCLLYSLEYGILIGVGLNLLFVLYASARPKLNLIKEKIQSCQHHTIYMITPQDTLHFPAAEHVRDTILAWPENGLIVILNGKYIRSMDVTVAKTLSILAQELGPKGQEIIFVNFKMDVIRMCVAVDKNMEENFQEGELKDIIKRFENNLSIL